MRDFKAGIPVCTDRGTITSFIVILLALVALLSVGSSPALADSASSGTLREQASLIDSGGAHTCKILEKGSLRCWGRNSNGQLGYGNTTDIGDNESPSAAGPVNLGSGRSAEAITAGGTHTCAILDNGTVRCWGANSQGQLGYGNTTPVGVSNTPAAAGPVNLGAGRTATAISSGQHHTCAILDNGTVRCWGRGSEGQLGYGNPNVIGDNEAPGSVGPVDLGAGRFATAISAGQNHTCAILDDSTVRCWGEGANGRLGYGNQDRIGETETPGSVGTVQLGADRTAIAISAGGLHTCAILDNGDIRCWGLGASGQLGYGNNNSIGDNELPASVASVELDQRRRATAITAGENFTCIRVDDGSSRCWGAGGTGRLGNLSPSNVDDPTALPAINVGSSRNVVALSSGDAHTCARLENGAVRCWGEGDFGRLGYGNGGLDIGDGETPGSVSPVSVGTDPRVALPGRAKQIVAGPESTCALLDDGTVRCWGKGLGDTETPGSLEPINLGTARVATELTSGGNKVCALLDDGSVTCWEAVLSGNANPVDLGPGRSAIDVSAGANHACAVLDNGKIRCWGANESGQLGNGNTGRNDFPGTLPPVDLGFRRLATDVEVGSAHTCAQIGDGEIRCWGAAGALGYGDGEDVGDDEAPGTAGDVPVTGTPIALDLSTDTCARMADGNVRCWGGGDTPDIDPPIDIGGRTVWDMSFASDNACVRLSSGGVVCWGGNKNGQLGYGNTDPFDFPGANPAIDLAPTGTDNVFDIASGDRHNCAVMDTREVRCWGFGEGGRLGYANGDTIGDDELPRDVGVVDITDDPPVAVADIQTIIEDTPTPIEVLLNENDPDGGTLKVISATQPANGTTSVPNSGGNVVYTPNANYCNSVGTTAKDTFDYTLNGGSTATATITVTCIDDAPKAVDDLATIAKDADATTISVLDNDTDPDGGPLAIVSTSDPTNGVVTINAGGGAVKYKPDAGYCNSNTNVRDAFTYDLNGGSSATVTVKVDCALDPVDDPEAPQTTLTKTPKKKVQTKKKKKKVKFEFTSSEPNSTFECFFDGNQLRPCTSPMKFKAKRGKHTFSVQATDIDGNTDVTPATYTFKVKKKKKGGGGGGTIPFSAPQG